MEVQVSWNVMLWNWVSSSDGLKNSSSGSSMNYLYLPNNMTSQPTKLESTATPLWERQMSQLFVSYCTKEVQKFHVCFHSNRSEILISSNSNKMYRFQYFMQKPKDCKSWSHAECTPKSICFKLPLWWNSNTLFRMETYTGDSRLVLYLLPFPSDLFFSIQVNVVNFVFSTILLPQ